MVQDTAAQSQSSSTIRAATIRDHMPEVDRSSTTLQTPEPRREMSGMKPVIGRQLQAFVLGDSTYSGP
ncbi:hypothetical protein FRB95_007057 [Tulasnella sp. JGI-2019a]|nr:hypothetical protein FRB93_003852 [Tulasnella sp. JGI-2019a]KAG9027928.1 hypothetical protein FRB95_007057 [Tulasnella sp. JGI-2019a]